VPEDAKESELPAEKGFSKAGISGFDFDNAEVKCGNRNAQQRTNFLKLLIHLWPGDWKEQLRKLNSHVKLDNAVRKSNTRHG
jgi:hypothetical protein